MAKDAKEKARIDVRRAQSKFERVDSQRDDARIARRESFERARSAGLSLHEIAKAAGLHFTRIGQILREK